MGPLQIIGGILLILSSLLLITIVIMQESKQSGLGAMTGGSSDSYLSKNKGKTMDAKLVLITKIFAIAFFVITIALNLVIRYVK